jgi:hypothetical protein
MFPGAGAVSERVPQETGTSKVGGSPCTARAVAADIRAGVPGRKSPISLIMRVLFQDYGLAPLRMAALSSQGNWFGLRCSWLFFHLCCRTLRTFATEAVGKLAAIIRVNLGVVLGSGNRHIGEAVVNQEFALICVHVDQHPLRGLSLAAVAGHCVSMVEVRVLSDVESNLAARVQADTKVTLRADSLDSAEFSVRELQFLRWCRELDAVALGEFMRDLAPATPSVTGTAGQLTPDSRRPDSNHQFGSQGVDECNRFIANRDGARPCTVANISGHSASWLFSS